MPGVLSAKLDEHKPVLGEERWRRAEEPFVLLHGGRVATDGDRREQVERHTREF